MPVIVKKTAVVALAPAVVMPSPKVDMSLINNLEKVNTGLNALNLQNKAALEKKENWKARLKHTAAWKNSTIPNIRKN